MLASWKKSYDQHRQHIKKQRHYFVNKGHLVKVMVFPVVTYGYESWTIKKAEHPRIDVFKLGCWKRSWCWERLKAGGDGDDWGWDGWMASSIQWTWVWVNSGSWWWTGRPGVLWSMGSQRVGHDWVTELNRIFVGKVTSLLFNMLSMLVIAFFPRSKHLLISCLQSLSTVILEPKKIKSVTVSPYICHDGTRCHDLWFLNVEF